MAYSRTISVQGTETIESKAVTISFNYTAGVAPTTVNFSMNDETGVSLYGNCSSEKIENYNVSGGIVTDEFLLAVKTKCVAALAAYETI